MSTIFSWNNVNQASLIKKKEILIKIFIQLIKSQFISSFFRSYFLQVGMKGFDEHECVRNRIGNAD